MIVLILVAILWLAVLVPGIISKLSERRNAGSIGRFHERLHLLERTGPKLVQPAYRLTGTDGASSSVPMIVPVAPPPVRPSLRLVSSPAEGASAMFEPTSDEPTAVIDIADVVVQMRRGASAYGHDGYEHHAHEHAYEYEEETHGQGGPDEAYGYEDGLQGYGDESYDDGDGAYRYEDGAYEYVDHLGFDEHDEDIERRRERRSSAAFERQHQARRRRRNAFGSLCAIAAFTGLLGLAHPLRGAWVVSGIALVVLAGFVGLAAYGQRMEAERRHLAKLERAERERGGDYGHESTILKYLSSDELSQYQEAMADFYESEDVRLAGGARAIG